MAETSAPCRPNGGKAAAHGFDEQLARSVKRLAQRAQELDDGRGVVMPSVGVSVVILGSRRHRHVHRAGLPDVGSNSSIDEKFTSRATWMPAMPSGSDRSVPGC